MIYSLIRYSINVPNEDWEHEVLAFVRAIDRDPSLRGRVSYRCLKEGDGVSFCHIAAAVNDAAVDDLKERPFFRPYSAKLRAIAKCEPEFTKMQVVGGTEIQL
jgi:hypothetical protein